MFFFLIFETKKGLNSFKDLLKTKDQLNCMVPPSKFTFIRKI